MLRLLCLNFRCLELDILYVFGFGIIETLLVLQPRVAERQDTKQERKTQGSAGNAQVLLCVIISAYHL